MLPCRWLAVLLGLTSSLGYTTPFDVDGAGAEAVADNVELVVEGIVAAMKEGATLLIPQRAAESVDLGCSMSHRRERTRRRSVTAAIVAQAQALRAQSSDE